MFKNILILIIISLLATGCLNNESGKQQQEANQKNKQNNQVDLGLLGKTYQKEVKVVLNNYLRQSQDESLITINFVEQTKNSLLALKGVPAEFRELHFNLVMAMNRMIEYLNTGDQSKRQESEQLIKQAKEDYDWLN